MISGRANIPVSAPPKPILLWDGDCGFCKYWVSRWHYLTKDGLSYIPYQERTGVLREIPASYFKKAVRLIGNSGKIYSGAAAVYRALHLSRRWKFLWVWYHQIPLFRVMSENGYSWVARNRPLLLKISILLFGDDPTRLRHYWGGYLLLLFGLLFLGYELLA